MTSTTEHPHSRKPTSSVRRMLHAAASRASCQAGVALVEFALVLPFLMLGLFGLAQGGLAFNSGIDQTHIANEIARYAVVNENPGGAESLQKWAKKQADQSALKTGKVCITFPNGTAKVGDPVKVEFKSTFKWFAVVKLVNLSTDVIGNAVMRLEAAPTKYSEGCA